jgi:hypothetical protein
METQTDEEYISTRLAQGDIENAIRLLNHARTEADTTIKSVIVKYCIIEYAKPFKKSRGVFQKKFIPLDKTLVFPSGNSDHEALITERDQRIAHGDITAYNPSLHYWPDLDIFPIVQRPSHLCDQIDILIDKMLALCDIVLRYLVDRRTTLEMLFRQEIEKTRT